MSDNIYGGMVSVVIPTHGRKSDLIKISVESALAQDYSPVEVIVVDDNPMNSAESADVKQYCAGLKRVRYIKQFGSRGACAARNTGIANANGFYVGFLDDDDSWMPDKISASLPCFKDDNVAMAASRGYTVTMKGGEVLSQSEYMPGTTKFEIGFSDLLVNDTIGTTTQAIARRDRLIECGGFNEALPARQDYDMWLRLTRKYKIAVVDRFLFNHIQHEYDQITKNPARALKGYQLVYAEFKKDFDADPDAFVSIHEYIMKRQRDCGQRFASFRTLMKIVARRPRYIGAYIADNTKNEKLRARLNARRRHALYNKEDTE